MTPEQQRIAIAEACGWTVLEPEVKPAIIYLWALRQGFIHEENREIIPDYLNDLNAMHEAEKTLTDKAHEEFRLNLYEVLGDDSRLIVSSTAAQRAEAFLLTIRKWEEAK